MNNSIKADVLHFNIRRSAGEQITDFVTNSCSSSTSYLRTGGGIPEGPKLAEEEKTDGEEVTLAEVPWSFFFIYRRGENGQESGGHRHETLTFKQTR